MSRSNIEWTEMTWNPTTGCNKVSAGCKFCYAERMSKRLKAMGQPKYQNGFQITTHPEALKVPYTWKKPQLVFVYVLNDPGAFKEIFHEGAVSRFAPTAPNIQNDGEGKAEYHSRIQPVWTGRTMYG